MFVRWLIHVCDIICDMTQSYVQHECFMSSYSNMNSSCVWNWLSYAWHASIIIVTWLIHTCDMKHHVYAMPHSYLWHDRFLFPGPLLDVAEQLKYVWHDSFLCVIWTDLHARHDSCTVCVACLIQMCDMAQSYVWHASFMCVACCGHTCDLTHSEAWHYLFINVACSWRWHLSDWWEKYHARACFCWLVRDKTPPSRLLRAVTWHLYNWKACRI